MSLAEVEKAVDELSPKELTKLAAYTLFASVTNWLESARVGCGEDLQ